MDLRRADLDCWASGPSGRRGVSVDNVNQQRSVRRTPRVTIARWTVVLMLVVASTVVGAGVGTAALNAAARQPPTQQDEFVPISELPPQDRLPAAPLLIGAYVFVLAVLFVYVLSVARRLTALQRDVARLEADLAKRARH